MEHRIVRHWARALPLALGLCAGAATAQDAPIRVDTMRLVATEAAAAETYFGTVRASEIFGLSYEARGCIVEVAEAAKRARVAKAGEVLVRLDDQRSQLAMLTAEARLLELAATVDERQLSVESARADDTRRQQDLELMTEEYQRNSNMLVRGLINETTMDAVERRFLDAKFAADRAKEAIASAEAAKKRAEIALAIGELDLRTAELNDEMLLLKAPFDGVLVGFDVNAGDCVQEGALAARIYEPDQKSVDVYFRISRLTAPQASGLSIGSTLKVTRVNEERCDGTLTRFDTEADPETQFVEATIELDPSCAPSLFLNEAVKVEPITKAGEASFTVPADAMRGEDTVFLVDEETRSLVSVTVEVVSRGERFWVVRIPGGDGRLLVTGGDGSMADGMAVEVDAAG